MILELHLPPISIVSSFKFIIRIISQWYNFSGLFFFCLNLLTEKNFQICRKLNLLTFCLRHCNCELFEGISKKNYAAIQFISTLNTGDLFLGLNKDGFVFAHPWSFPSLSSFSCTPLSFVLLGFWMVVLLHVAGKDMQLWHNMRFCCCGKC